MTFLIRSDHTLHWHESVAEPLAWPTRLRNLAGLQPA